MTIMSKGHSMSAPKHYAQNYAGIIYITLTTQGVKTARRNVRNLKFLERESLPNPLF